MAHKYNMKQWLASLKKKAEKLRNVSPTENRIARHIGILAQMYAPRDKGALRAGITVRKNRVSSAVPGPFPYQLWVNQEPGYETMSVRKYMNRKGVPVVWISSSRRWVEVNGGLMRYGSAPTNWKWTGKPGYFDKAVVDSRPYFTFVADKWVSGIINNR